MTYNDISSPTGPSMNNPPFDASRISSDITSSGTTLASAQAAYTTAYSEYESAKSDALSKATALSTATAELSAAESALQTANTDLQSAVTTLQNAESDLQTATTNLETAESNYQAALKAYQDDPNTETEAALQAAEAARTTAQTNYDNALTARDNAKTAKDTAQGVYDVALADRNAKQSALTTATTNYTTSKATYDSKRTALATATTNLEAASTASATAYARSEIFTSSTKQQETDTTVQGLEEHEAFDLLPGLSGGLTAADFQELLGDYQALSEKGTALQAAYNAYRYLEWQIADAVKRRREAEQSRDNIQILFNAGLATQGELDTANAAVSTIESEISGYKGQRASKLSALDTALSEYQQAYGLLPTKITDAVDATKTFYTTWNSSITTAVNTAINAYTQYKTEKEAEDAAQKAAYLEAHEEPSTQSISDAFTTVMTDYMTKARAAEETRPAVFSFDFSQITLPAPGQRVSMSQLIGLIAQLQVIMDQFIKELSYTDSRLRMYMRTMGITELGADTGMSNAFNAFFQALFEADTLYNNEVAIHNMDNFVRTSTLYQMFKDHTNVINATIDQINADIDTQNANAEALADAANSVGANYSDAINATRSDRSVARNTMDFLSEEPASHLTPLEPISQPTTVTPAQAIQHYAHITSLPNPPVADMTTNPPTLPSQSEIDAWNQAIETLLQEIAPFKERIIQAIADATGDPSISQFELQPFVAESTVPVREGTIGPSDLSFFIIMIGFLFFLMVVASMQQGAQADLAKQGEVLAKLAEFMGEYLPSQESLAQAIKDAVGGAGLLTLDIRKNPALFGVLLATITTNEVFYDAMKRIVEQASIVSGLQTAGKPPQELLKFLFEHTASGSLTTKEKELLTKLIEKTSSDAFVHALIDQLLAASSDSDRLHGIALDAIRSMARLNLSEISEEELKQLIAVLMNMLQLLLLLVAAFLGVSVGSLSPEELIAGKAMDTLGKTLKNMGIRPDIAEGVARHIGSLLPSVFPALIKAGLTPQQAMAALIVMSLQAMAIPPSEAGTLGPFFTDSLLTLFKEARLIPSETETFDMAQISQALRTFVHQSALDEKTKTDLLHALEWLMTPPPSLSAREPILPPKMRQPTPPLALASFLKTFLEQHLDLQGLLDKGSLSSLSLALQQLGIRPEDAQKLALQLATQFVAAYPLLLEMGLSSERAMAILLALSLKDMNIPAGRKGALGAAFQQELLSLLQEAGALAPGEQKVDLSKLLPALQRLIEQSGLSNEQKASLLRLFELITTLPVSFQPTVPGTPSISLAGFLRTFLQEHPSLEGLLETGAISSLARALQQLGIRPDEASVLASQLAAQFVEAFPLLLEMGLSSDQALAALVALSLQGMHIPLARGGALGALSYQALLSLVQKAGIPLPEWQRVDPSVLLPALNVLLNRSELSDAQKATLLRLFELITTLPVLAQPTVPGTPSVSLAGFLKTFLQEHPSLKGLLETGAISSLARALQQLGIRPDEASVLASQLAAQFVEAFPLLLEMGLSSDQALAALVALSLQGMHIPLARGGALGALSYQALLSLVQKAGIPLPEGQRVDPSVLLPSLRKLIERSDLDTRQKAELLHAFDELSTLPVSLQPPSATPLSLPFVSFMHTFLQEHPDLEGLFDEENISSLSRSLQPLVEQPEQARMLATHLAAQFASSYPILLEMGLSSEQAIAALSALSLQGMRIPLAQGIALGPFFQQALVPLFQEAGFIGATEQKIDFSQIMPALKSLIDRSDLDEAIKANLFQGLDLLAMLPAAFQPVLPGTPPVSFSAFLRTFLETHPTLEGLLEEGALASLSQALQQLGLKPEEAQTIVPSLASQFVSTYPLLLDMGLSSEEAMAALSALSLQGMNIPLTQRGALGPFFYQALLQLAKKGGVVAPTAQTVDMNQLMPALRSILGQSDLGASEKQSLLQLLGQIAAPQFAPAEVPPRLPSLASTFSAFLENVSSFIPMPEITPQPRPTEGTPDQPPRMATFRLFDTIPLILGSVAPLPGAPAVEPTAAPPTTPTATPTTTPLATPPTTSTAVPTVAPTSEPAAAPTAAPTASPAFAPPSWQPQAEALDQLIASFQENPPTLAPSQRVEPILQAYRRLTQEERAEIEAALPGSLLSAFPEIERETLAAVVMQISGGTLSVDTANLLLSLLQIEATKGIQAALASENEIIHNLFAPTEEDILTKEYWQKKAYLLADLNQKLTRPSTLPPTTKEKLKARFEFFSKRLSDSLYTKKIAESFLRALVNMTSFAEVAMKRILDPGNSLIRDFSIITRTGNNTGPLIFGS